MRCPIHSIQDQLLAVEQDYARVRAVSDALEEMAGLSADETDPRTITGYALKWNSVAHGAAGPTRFSTTAFGNQSQRLPLLWSHDVSAPIGVVVVEPDDIGLRATAKIADTQKGREAIELIRTGATSGMSIGFNATKSHPEKGIRIVDAGTLAEVSIVVFPADSDARVDGVGGQPVLHCAEPHETMGERSSIMHQVEEIESDYRRVMGLPEPKAPKNQAESVSEVDPTGALARMRTIRRALVAEAERENPITRAIGQLYRGERS